MTATIPKLLNVKDVWTEADYAEMSWHDSRIYSISLPNEKFSFSMSIDYIFKWEWQEQKLLGFWVSPCILTFNSVSNFRIDLSYGNNMLLFIDNIIRMDTRPTPNGKLNTSDYRIECDNGDLSFSAIGFAQNVLKPPIFTDDQDLGRPFKAEQIAEVEAGIAELRAGQSIGEGDAGAMFDRLER